MRTRDELGQVAGIEMVVFGVLVLVLGLLAVCESWAVVDGKLAVIDASREAARAFVQAPSPAEAESVAAEAASAALRGEGRDPARMTMTVEGTLTRCARISVEVGYRLDLVTIPLVGGFGRVFTTKARHSELVDPYRSGLPGAAGCQGP